MTSRRARRAQGDPADTRRLLQAIQCPDCDSRVMVIESADGTYSADVSHDETCPWYLAFQQAGGLGIRFSPINKGETTP